MLCGIKISLIRRLFPTCCTNTEKNFQGHWCIMVFGKACYFNIHNLQIFLSHSNNHVYFRSRMKWLTMRNLCVILLWGKQLLLAIFRPNSSLVIAWYVFFNLGRISAVVEQDERQKEARSTSNCYLCWRPLLERYFKITSVCIDILS